MLIPFVQTRTFTHILSDKTYFQCNDENDAIPIRCGLSPTIWTIVFVDSKLSSEIK